MPKKIPNHAFDTDKSREQLLQEIYKLRESLTTKERRCLELSEENTRLARTLPEKEAFYQILYEHIPLAYQSLDAAGNIIAVNKTWLSIFGYTHEEVNGRNFADFLHPDCVEHFRENFHRLKSVSETGVELEMIKKDGCLLLVSLHGKISRDNLGNLWQTHCIIEDITERKRTEEDLRRYRQIVSFTPDGISLVDQDYRYRIVNDAYETFSGRKREQLLGRHIAEYLGEEAFHTQVQPSFDRCLQGETIRYKAWFDYPALGRRFVDVTYFPYQEFDGSITGIVASTRDITDVKQVEEALRRSEAHYRLLHESMRDGFVHVMMDGRIIDCNEIYCRMLGYSAEELRFLTYIKITPERWHDFEAAIVCDQILSRGFSDIYEKEYRRKDGTVFPVELRTILIRDDRGRPAAMWAIVRDITERKQAEEALLRERNVLQSVMNGAKNLHLVYLDRDFNFVRVNETYATSCGYQPEEMIGKNHFDLYPHAENEAIFARVRDTGEPFEVKDKPFQFPDQPERGITYWDWTLSPVTDDNGKVNGLVFSLYETTGRKRAEKALKSSERKFRRLFEKHSATMLLIDPVSLVILDANPAASKFYGYSRSKLRTMKIDSINCAPPNEFSELAKQIEEQKLDYFITPHRLADGSVRTVEVYLSPIPIQKRRFEFVVIHDITDRKAAEDALRQNEARLKATNDKLLESEQRLQLFIEHAPAALAMFDDKMRYLSVSSRWLKDYNLEDRNLNGMLHYEVFPNLPERWKEAHRRGLSGEVLREEADLYERADGSCKWVRWEIHPWLKHSGEVGGIVIFTEDITERKQQEVQLQILNEELEQRVRERTRELIETQHQFLHAEKLAAIGRLSASIAHEVNNPLQSILTVLKGLSKQANLPELDLKLVGLAIGEGDRIKGLIRSLQDFYRPSSRRKALLNINNTLDLLLLLHKSDFKSRRIIVKLDYDNRLPMISVVSDQIKQVFLNMLINAAEACSSSRGGVITISTRRQGDKAVVAIKDTGVGINPEQMDQIFRPFYTTKSEVKGTGLGLSVSYGIVKNHGGEILVTSKPGEGATFTVLLPINNSDPDKIQ